MLSFIATFWTDFDEFAIFGIHITLSNELYMDVRSVNINRSEYNGVPACA
jgi:hypothetical protein